MCIMTCGTAVSTVVAAGWEALVERSRAASAARMVGRLGRSPVVLVRAMINDWRVLVVAYAGFIAVAAALFSVFEQRPFWDGVWWAFITGLTIGYGDVYPTTVAGRLTGLVLAHAVIMGVIPMIIANVTLKLIHDRNEFTHEEQEQLKSNQRQLHDQLSALQAQLERLNERETATGYLATVRESATSAPPR